MALEWRCAATPTQTGKKEWERVSPRATKRDENAKTSTNTNNIKTFLEAMELELFQKVTIKNKSFKINISWRTRFAKQFNLLTLVNCIAKINLKKTLLYHVQHHTYLMNVVAAILFLVIKMLKKH